MITISKFEVAKLFGLEYHGEDRDHSWSHKFIFHGNTYYRADYDGVEGVKEEVADEILKMIGKAAVGK